MLALFCRDSEDFRAFADLQAFPIFDGSYFIEPQKIIKEAVKTDPAPGQDMGVFTEDQPVPDIENNTMHAQEDIQFGEVSTNGVTCNNVMQSTELQSVPVTEDNGLHATHTIQEEEASGYPGIGHAAKVYTELQSVPVVENNTLHAPENMQGQDVFDYLSIGHGMSFSFSTASPTLLATEEDQWEKVTVNPTPGQGDGVNGEIQSVLLMENNALHASEETPGQSNDPCKDFAVQDQGSSIDDQEYYDDSDQDPQWEPTNSDNSSDDDYIDPKPKRQVVDKAHPGPKGQAVNEANPEPDGQVVDDANPEPEGHVVDQAKGKPEREGRPRKRKCDPSKWKQNVRKRLCQEGKPYISVRGKLVGERAVKTLKNCDTACKFRCMDEISNDERNHIHDSYYKLDQDRKSDFISHTSKCGNAVRSTAKGPSRRKKSFSYYFTVSEKKIRVCKLYYLGTLCISQKIVYRVHGKKNKITGTPQSDRRGKHAKRVTSEATIQCIKDHIQSFPAVESHYCRAKSGKLYLESSLNITKMYELYVEKCNAEASAPVKCHIYRNIFNSMTPALDFHKPKSDRCDKCEHYESAQKNNTLSDELRESHQMHVTEKETMREQRRLDRDDKDKLVISFDLENVITCPKAEISSFFYRKKLNMYNLTGYDSLSKTGYCVVWCETTSGRSGNDIASAVIQILERAVENHREVKHITTWSDSCVPQNRNSVIAFAVSEFLSRHPTVETVTMKYCTPGHSAIQEIDNIHSVLERAMSVAEFYSPVAVIRIMLKASRKRPYTVIQMRRSQFKDYQLCAKSLDYKLVPFFKVTSLKLDASRPFEVQYKLSHQADTFEVKNIKPVRRGRKNREIRIVSLRPKAQDAAKFNRIPPGKIADLKEMLKFMPLLDKEYYQSTFNIKAD